MNDARFIMSDEPVKEMTVVQPIEEASIVRPDQLIELAIQKGATIEMLERLLALRERIQKDEAEKAFLHAMSAFQAECPVIPREKKVLNKDGKTVRYFYAPLDDIVKKTKPIIGKHELSYDIEAHVISTVEFTGIESIVTVFHVLGHSRKSAFSVPVDLESYMTDQQKWASAQTFAKRYAFCNAFGILTGDEDNDGNSLEDEKLKQQAKKKADEIKQKIHELPDNIKEGFKILGYTSKAVWHFCDMREWGNEKIHSDINSIIDGQNNVKRV